MMLALLLAFQICPADAQAVACAVGITNLGITIAPERSITVRMTVTYLDFDFMQHRTMAFRGGTMLLHAGTQTYDLTPPAGVPWLGPSGCATQRSYSRDMTLPLMKENTFRSEYVGGRTGIGLAVSGSSTGLVVRIGDGPLQYKRQGDGLFLWFYGSRTNYAIEHSTDLRAWTDLAILAPDATGRAELSVTGRGFWRYRRN